MGLISAVEAWFVMVSPVDSISANLKGNPGLALAARKALFQDHTDKFLCGFWQSLVHNTVCYTGIIGVIGSSASMRLPAN